MAIAHQNSFSSADAVSATGGIGSATYTTADISDADCTLANNGFLVVGVIYPKMEVNGGLLSVTVSRGVGAELTSLTSLGRQLILTTSLPVPNGGGGTYIEFFSLAATDTGGGDLTASKTLTIKFFGFTYNNTGQNFLFVDSLYTGVQAIRNMNFTKDATADWGDTITTGDISSWAYGVAVTTSGSSILGAGSGTTRRAITGDNGSSGRKFACFDSNTASGGSSYTINYDINAADTCGSAGVELVFIEPFAFPSGNVITFF